ncbi:MAG: DUF4367 domain-containing protein [Chloroflexi bacterium]|nr:MAG: DUF4367 domain-containing protein [Chloroflexota bacterium]MBL1193665.1 DUF4367 domain-containing protein [Chloroflexota bacterium]NOH10957.1 DUF4367 domain-containing protein [Chloroflexota bacterium]
MNQPERQLTQAAQDLPYPQAPDIATQVDWAAIVKRQSLPRSRRLAWAVIVLLLAAASLLAVPSVRASLIEFLQIGGVRILLPETSATPGKESPPAPTVTRPDPSQDFIVSILDLDGATSLEQARQVVDSPIELPAYPDGLREPDHVFISDVGTGLYVVLAWTAPDDPEKVEVSLYILGPGVRLTKGEPQVIEETQVNDQPAAFIEGVHLLSVDGFANPARLVSGPVLLWQEGDLTYRLEADLPQDEMIRIAESLQP